VNNIDPSGRCSFTDPISCTEYLDQYIAPVVLVGVGLTDITLAGAACFTGVLCPASVVVASVGAAAVGEGFYLGYLTYF